MVINALKETEKTSHETELKLTKAAKKPKKESSLLSETEVAKPLDELVGYAEKAYVAYREAEQELARAFKENEEQAIRIYQRAEKKAQIFYDQDTSEASRQHEETITQAIKAHDEAIRHEEEKLKKASQEADEIFHEKLAKALTERNSAIDEALKVRDNTIQQSWTIYSRIRN